MFSPLFSATPSSGPVPGLDSLDRAIAEWTTRLERVDANLVDLESQPTYSLLNGGLTVQGQTRDRVVPALQAMEELFAQRALLHETLDHARTLRATMNRLFPSEKTLREIDAALNGPSISLPTIQTPLARRSLVSAAVDQQHVSPEQLLHLMTEAFERARDAVLEVDEAWDRVMPALERAEREVAAVEQEAASLGLAGSPTFTALRAEILAVKQHAVADPLGAQDGFERGVLARLGSVRDRLRAQAQLRTSVLEALAAARERQGRAARAAGRRLDRAVVDDLGSWLERIGQTVDQGHYDGARVGLARWAEAATAAYGAEETRQEQKGFLSALRAKAQSLRNRGLVVDASLDLLAQDAEAALGDQPARLDEARDLIARYERGLSALR